MRSISPFRRKFKDILVKRLIDQLFMAAISSVLIIPALVSGANPSTDPRLSGLPPLPKGAIVVTNPLDGNCGASNQLDEPIQIKTKTTADCQKWLAAVAEGHKHWPSEATRAQSAIDSIANASEFRKHRLYAVIQCYYTPSLGEHCVIVNAADPTGQPFGSLKACQTFVVKYLVPEVPQNGKFPLAGGNWYQCASRPDDRWEVPN